MATRNPVNSAVEVGSFEIYHYLRGFGGFLPGFLPHQHQQYVFGNAWPQEPPPPKAIGAKDY